MFLKTNAYYHFEAMCVMVELTFNLHKCIEEEEGKICYSAKSDLYCMLKGILFADVFTLFKYNCVVES